MTKPIQEQDPVTVELQGINDLLEQILARTPTAAERRSAEDREAWDGFVREALRYRTSHRLEYGDLAVAFREADMVLEERRKRFPPPETKP